MPPPELAPILDEIQKKGSSRLMHVVSNQLQAETTADPYLPWDKLRFKKPPGDLTHEEWWLVTKLGRQALQRSIPLLDMEGKPFTYALPDEALKAIEEVNKYLSGHIAMAERVATSANRDDYLMNSLMEEAITSSQLEGAATTQAVAKEMIRSGRPPSTKDERMIYNNYAAMRRIRDLRGQPLTIDLLHELHQIVTDQAIDNPEAAGRFQLPGEVRVVVVDVHGTTFHEPPPAEELPERMQRLCDFANGELGEAYVPGVIRAIIVHFMVGYEHPFEDGNGRTARALFYWMMLNQDYWLTEFLSISTILKNAPAQYGYSILYTEQDDNDLTYFILYQLKVIKKAIAELHSFLDRKLQEVRDFQRSIAAMPGEFNHRQLALLQHALRHSEAVYSVLTHGRSHDVTRQTARQDLFDLEERGLLTRTTQGRKFFWSPVADLVERLKG